MILEKYVPGMAGDIIAPYHDGTTFTRDFWMDDRVGAVQGALVAVYNEVNLALGMSGMGSARGPENYIVKAGPFERWNEATTSPGTPVAYGGTGWVPLGAEYRYDYSHGHGINLLVWEESGCPRENRYGRWANDGLPYAYVQWSWENPSTRGESPLSRRGGWKNRHRG